MGCMHAVQRESLRSLRIDDEINDECIIYTECSHIHRLRNVCEYYNKWISESITISIFQHVNKIYATISDDSITALLEDYHHLIHDHCAEFEEIYNYFCASKKGKCDVNQCSMISRNHRNRSSRNQNTSTYYTQNDTIENEDWSNEVITQQILDQIHCYVYHSFDMGFKLTKNEEENVYHNERDTKYINNVDEDAYDDEKERLVPQQSTEELIGRIIQRKKTQCSQTIPQNGNKFMSIIRTNQRKDSNNNRPMDSVFSFGVRYYYDQHKYKHNNQIDIEHNNGYRYMDWFVEKKYKDFKTELLNNTTCCIGKMQYKDLYHKSAKYLKTKHVLQNSKGIKQAYLLSVMIYCNFDEFQCEYSKTYRHLINESDKSMKKRHSEYAHFGNVLQDAVELYGTSVDEGSTKVFYHGINMELMFTSTLHKFCGPISTSSEYQVAFLFTKDTGILLELNDGTLLSQEHSAMYFDCQFISDYSYERELLFIGGKHPLKIVSIFHVGLNEQYTIYIQLITMLLSIVAGDISLNDEKFLTQKNEKALIKLLNHELKLPRIETIPAYITKLLHHICTNVERITTRYKSTFGAGKRGKYKTLGDFLCFNDCQMFKLKLVNQLFPNLTSIAIQRSSLTNKVFDHIVQFLNEHKEKPIKLNNIIFQCPISGSISFQTICKSYSRLLNEFDWSIQIDEKRLILQTNSSINDQDQTNMSHAHAQTIFEKSDTYKVDQKLDMFCG